ncbi:transcription antitermination factor NusB [Candidatus Collierbacteria bacterium]|nr:transcription antitermination factor NusB [Candidatus Collierbacteria bacterium]
MKTPTDPRHLNRIHAFKAIFAHSFTPQEIENELAAQTLEKLTEIDPIIVKCAPDWPLSQINRVDLSILRLALFELLFMPSTPTKVIIDEAIELAKRYGGQSSSSFVNGALASALKYTNREA